MPSKTAPPEPQRISNSLHKQTEQKSCTCHSLGISLLLSRQMPYNSCKRRLLSSFQSILNGFHKAFQARGVWEEDALQANLLRRSSRGAACNGTCVNTRMVTAEAMLLSTMLPMADHAL